MLKSNQDSISGRIAVKTALRIQIVLELIGITGNLFSRLIEQGVGFGALLLLLFRP